MSSGGGRWGRGRFSERSASPPDPLSRRAAGVWFGDFCIGGSACELGVSPIGLVMVTAADRAAATCQRWAPYSLRGDRAKVSKGRSQSPLARPQTRPPRRTSAAALSAAVDSRNFIRGSTHSQAEPTLKNGAPQTPAALREGARGRSFSQRSCLPRSTPVLLTSPVFSLSPT